MAFSLPDAKAKVEFLYKPYAEHLLKCIIFGDKTRNLWHWCDEIAGKLSKVNNILLKSGGKLSQKYYENEFLLACGDCNFDFELTLEEFQKKFRLKYSSFEITDELIDYTTKTFLYFSKCLTPILCKVNNRSKDWFRNIILDYFEY